MSNIGISPIPAMSGKLKSWRCSIFVSLWWHMRAYILMNSKFLDPDFLAFDPTSRKSPRRRSVSMNQGQLRFEVQEPTLTKLLEVTQIIITKKRQDSRIMNSNTRKASIMKGSSRSNYTADEQELWWRYRCSLESVTSKDNHDSFVTSLQRLKGR